jgi:class 3 adenylate cyclase
VPQIVVLNGASEGAVFALPEIPTVVGRSPESHVQIGDPWISSMHALFERRGGEIWVVDLDSRNGTYIGDARVTEAPVADGAVVRFGQTDVRVEHAGRTVAPPPEAEPDRGRARDALRGEATVSTRLPTPRGPADDPWALARRRGTVLRLAVDAAGVEELAGAPERLRGALEAIARAALDSGAVVTRLGGAGVLAVYGLTGAAPEDAARALAAARSARREVRARGGLELRAAFDTGVVLAGDAGSGGFELAALGPAAETAERLLAAARRGEILAGPGAAEAAGLASGGLRTIGDVEIEVFPAGDE